jgi:hypothetical protein
MKIPSADIDAVDEDHAGALGLAEARAPRVDLERLPVGRAEDRIRLDADRFAELPVQAHPLVVAVKRHQIARAQQVQHQLQLLCIAMARRVNRGVTCRDDIAADLVEAVDGLVDGSFVAGDRRRREDDGVALAQRNLRVVAVGHAPQRRERLALRAGRDDHDLIVAEVGELARRDHQAVRHLDVAQLTPDSDVLAHRAPDQRDLAVKRGGGVDDLLHAVDVRGEARDDDPSPGPREDLLELRSDDRLGGREAIAVGVRRVPAQEQHALGPELREPRDVGRLAIHGRLVELVVAGEHHGSELACERDRARVGDRVRHVDQLRAEGPQLERLARLDIDQDGVAQLVLVELRTRHRHRQGPAIDRRHRDRRELAQDPGQRPEVVLVPVRDDDRLDVRGALAQVAEVRQDEVDADHLRGREAQTDIDDDDPIVLLDDGHVLADLAQPPEGEYPQLAHAVSWPTSSWRTSIARTISRSRSSTSTSGRRRPPTRCPSSSSAAFVGAGLAVMKIVS